MSIEYSFERAFQKMEDRGWKYIFIAVDAHDTIFRGQYRDDDYEVDPYYYPWALEALKMLSDRDDIKLILWSASQPDYMKRVSDYLHCMFGIDFEYLNENPEVGGDALIRTDRKIYFDVGIDDKMFFNANHDWKKVIEVLKETPCSTS